MKNRKMLDMMSLADEKYVSEADPTNARAKATSKFKWTTIFSIAACFLLILNIAILVPILNSSDEPSTPNSDGSLNGIGSGGLIQNGASSLPNQDGTDSSPNNGTTHIQNPSENGDEDKDEEIYTPDMQFLKNPQLLSALDKYFGKNNNSVGDLFDKVEEELENEELQDAISPDTGSNGAVSPDINDNQVQGISEGDIAKRSDKYLFYLRGTTLYIYSINGNASKAECMLPLASYLEKAQELSSQINFDKYETILDSCNSWQMYLSSDYKTLTIIIIPDYAPASITGILTLDVSSAPSVEFKDFKMFAGEYITSRFVDDEILLFTRYAVSKYYDKKNPMAYIPFYTENDETRYTDDIYFPSELSANTYVTISRLSQKKLRVLESVSYLSYSDKIYVSGENIYLTREIPINSRTNNGILVDKIESTYRVFEPIDTEIAVIGYKSALFQNKGTAMVQGYVNNQYSMDEYEGILRVATTSYVKKEGTTNTYESSASLWCIDISTMEIAASVANFAPIDDVVRSVRFDGTNGYVCTSLQKVIFSDPVFFFDLSDLENITYTDTGIIDGFSSSLINIGGGYLIGIGYGNSSTTLKIEVYKEEEGRVVTVCVEEFYSTRFSTDYKSYYVDRENHLIGLAISSYSSDSKKYEDSYLLLHFDGTYFDKVMALGIAQTHEECVRAFYQQNYFYIVTDLNFYTFEVGRLSNLPFTSTDGTTTGASDGTSTNTEEPTSRPSGPAWPSN